MSCTRQTTAMARRYAGASEAQDREAVRRLGEALGQSL